jgi:hypothetical protein
VVLTGRTALPPLNGELSYRILDGRGALLGEGRFPVPIPADARQVPFTASLTFIEPPQGGTITVQLLDSDPRNGLIGGSAEIQLTVAPRP